MMKIKSFLGFISFMLFVKLPESPDQPFSGNLHPEYTKFLFQNANLLSILSGRGKGICTKTAGISIKGPQTYLPFLFFNQ
jgi:hypothetical protein